MKTPFTKQQIEELLQNENVVKIKSKSITYTAAFKIRAVDHYINKGLTPKMIFTQAGFDVAVLGRDSPGWRMHDWLKKYKIHGTRGLTIDMRGKGEGGQQGRPKSLEYLTDEEKIKRLKLEVQYLKKENSFLARLRAKRAE